MAVSQLAYVGIGVSDMTRWKAFASDVLGLQVVEGEADGMVYIVTPSGLKVEYGWGARLVDDATWQVQRHDRGGLWGHAVQLQPSATAPSVTVGR
jgi:catechol 2,3-dioxygenase-like lactoylglutathione lyase family enzyme